MTELDIKVGHVYEAKKPKVAGIFYANDRHVLHIDPHFDEVQYDSPTVRNGRHYPRTRVEKFVKWAGRDVTDEMPEDGQWRMFEN